MKRLIFTKHPFQITFTQVGKTSVFHKNFKLKLVSHNVYEWGFMSIYTMVLQWDSTIKLATAGPAQADYKFTNSCG